MGLLGIIGGSGLYQMEELEIVERKKVSTPFGDPSDELVIGKLGGIDVVFLSRHGAGHVYSPSEINYRANIYALKSVGADRILSLSAVGSMKEEIKPGDLVVVEQFVDRTFRRKNTFFEGGVVAHVSMADPVCPELSSLLEEAVKKVTGKAVRGTYICIEGPQFSSRGESLIYRQWGVDVIGMTNATEAKLAREAEICYASLALVTDYDCWHISETPVTVEEIIKTMNENIHKARKVALEVASGLNALKGECSCRSALKDAIITAPSAIPPELKEKLKLIIGRYIS